MVSTLASHRHDSHPGQTSSPTRERNAGGRRRGRSLRRSPIPLTCVFARVFLCFPAARQYATAAKGNIGQIKTVIGAVVDVSSDMQRGGRRATAALSGTGRGL